MQIYVVNLARRPDRWTLWEASAKKGKVPPYERWDAVDGLTLEITTELKHLFRGSPFFRRKVVLACALSHYNIWKQIVKNNIAETIVFEDDAIFFEPLTIPKPGELPGKWDLFYFGGYNILGVSIPGTKIHGNIVSPQLPERIGFCTYAYMISLNGAKKLLALIEEIGINREIDWFMVKAFTNLNVYCYSPLTVFANPSLPSDIENPTRKMLEDNFRKKIRDLNNNK